MISRTSPTMIPAVAAMLVWASGKRVVMVPAGEVESSFSSTVVVVVGVVVVVVVVAK